ncbi:oxidoreductase domain protein [Pirellula staleyi DSM 6068]|uniref:Oxidoreductase domain protein n=1 Tax=Pirellula staleyi (strain ATCC 27377 / DSM 6068 / ICPB 4128) TaxID=530564 RepID=D2R4M4_PIRSD|nr:Gfo/Idh/MocA family oxidoreductase [Pirellula staleyi]ADB17090.1 oxidoreductase domain protein [Pirellula staleyi DSM 6068]
MAVNQNRRSFLKTTAAAASALAIPYYVPASVLGLEDKAPPSDRIVMGCIGTGGKGRHNMGTFMGFPDVQMVAVCDVDAKNRDMAHKQVNGHYKNEDCKAYNDFREITSRTDIDAVAISTPDHWHAIASIAAANGGKDIYCEKPLANSVAEGRGICNAVEKNKRILQTGTQERSGDNARAVCELVQAGRIGKLNTLRINLPCVDGHHLEARKVEGIPAAQNVPEGFDYNFWLGHTAEVPYTEKRCHFWWRFNLAYGGGEMTDRGAHVIDIGQLGAGMDATGPVEYEASGVQAKDSLYNVFWDYKFKCTYASGLEMIGEAVGPRGVKFEGADGWIFVHIHGQKLEASDEALLKEVQAIISKGDFKLGRSPGHHRNFIDCVKSRQPTIAPAEVGHRTGSICHLNNIAMTLGRKIKFDPASEQILGDEEAAKLLSPAMREPWKL